MDLVIILVKVDTAIVAVPTILMTVQDPAGLILLTVIALSPGIGVNHITQITVKSLVIGVGRKLISDLTALTMDHEYLRPKL
jgi:hypothetical protein